MPTDDVLVATKGGHRRPGDGSWTVHGDPAYVKEACEASLKRLGVDAIGLYQYHRPDPKVPWAESVGALADLLDEGKILMAGVSNATVAQIDEAQRVLGGRLVSVQNQFSPRFRSSEGELEHCEKLGIVFIPWSPLGGIGRADDIEQHPPRLRRRWPRRSAPAPSRSRWPGCWPRAPGSSRSPAAAAPRPPSPPPRQPTSTSTPEQVARLDAVLIGGQATAPVEQNVVPACSITVRRSIARDGHRGAGVARGSEIAMPAVTVPDNLVLPRITPPADRSAIRP